MTAAECVHTLVGHGLMTAAVCSHSGGSWVNDSGRVCSHSGGSCTLYLLGTVLLRNPSSN